MLSRKEGWCCNKSLIAWNGQGLKVLVDAHFGGLLMVPAGIPKDQKTVWIQTLFVSGMADEEDISGKDDEGTDSERDIPVAMFTTTWSKAKNPPKPDVVEKPAPKLSATALPSEKDQDTPL